MKALKLKKFLSWYLSDENEEGFYISDKAIGNMTDNQFKSIKKLFDDCTLVPKRLIEEDISNGGDYKVNEEVELIR